MKSPTKIASSRDEITIGQHFHLDRPDEIGDQDDVVKCWNRVAGVGDVNRDVSRQVRESWDTA